MKRKKQRNEEKQQCWPWTVVAALAGEGVCGVGRCFSQNVHSILG